MIDIYIIFYIFRIHLTFSWVSGTQSTEKNPNLDLFNIGISFVCIDTIIPAP